MKISMKSVLPFKEHSLNSLKGAFLEQELSSEDKQLQESTLKFTHNQHTGTALQEPGCREILCFGECMVLS